jgi:spermidine dehydrogenase
MSLDHTPDASDRALGMDAAITRRDFVNASLIGAGASLLSAAAPAAAQGAQGGQAKPPAGGYGPAGGAADRDLFTGYGGVGDYAMSNGNTKAVIDAAHGLRDGKYGAQPPSATDTGETYDLVIVGGGLSGLSAAYHYAKATGSAKRALILENHPIFGGEAKQNEFIVNGVRLIAPQGSNQYGMPRAGSGPAADLWDDLKLPRDIRYAEPDAAAGNLRIPLDNYAHMDGVNEFQVDIGYYFDEKSGAPKPTWLRNIWQNDLAEAPFAPEVKAQLLKWRTTGADNTEAFRRTLDGMSYKQYLEGTLGFREEVTHYIEPVVGLINGATPDAVSAFAAQQIGMPATGRTRSRTGPLPGSFPGGNGTYARHFVKWLIPAAFPGDADFATLLTAKLNWAALDPKASTQHTRIRLGSTVVRVEHEGAAGTAEGVRVWYAKGGRHYRVRAKRVVMASGSWVNRHVLMDQPATLQAAYLEFGYTPAMIVNVALTNWRFLKSLDIAAARWFGDGFGFSCNIRRPVVAGAYTPPVHPDQPTVLTFYLGLYTRGLPAYEQGVQGRTRLYGTPWATLERQVRSHLATLFGSHGFDPRKDIAGIITNRWGHARMVQPPGWYYGTNGRTPAREVVQAGYGRVTIAHSELNGHMNVTGAIAQGKRAGEATAAGA